MISNSPILAQIHYPPLDGDLPFADYIAQCQAMINTRHRHYVPGASNFKNILAANSPFELRPTTPTSAKKLPLGALLIHGLLDSPFSMREIAVELQQAGILCRSILLPGHGTRPSDLLHVTYQDWLSAVQYGIDSLKSEVEKIILIGYSTGGSLALYHALTAQDVAGIIMLAPAISVKAPVGVVVAWHRFLSRITNHRPWVFDIEEINYAKYCSVAFNAFDQVAKLSIAIKKISESTKVPCPHFTIVSLEDEIISARAALDFFKQQPGAKNKFLLYAASNPHYTDKRILVRRSTYSDLRINHVSHIGLPFSSHNPYYGQHGDFIFASRHHLPENVYGAYNILQVNFSELFYTLGLRKFKHRILTYNPDFAYMTKNILEFVKKIIS